MLRTIGPECILNNTLIAFYKIHAYLCVDFFWPYCRLAPQKTNIFPIKMHLPSFPFQLTDWSNIPPEEHIGETGMAYWKVLHFGEVRVRMVEYSANYMADHWCNKGHFIFCIEGEMTTELKDGRTFTLLPGMTYQVGDNANEHRTYSENGVKIFIVD
jgi:quercetin dioxygenase-like cupin family protein